MEKQEQQGVSSGIEALISRLREEGVTAGKQEAEKKLHAAELQAKKVLENARNEARQILEQAQSEADKLRNNVEQDLKIAMRDTVLGLKVKLNDAISESLRKLISAELASHNFLQQLILEIAARARSEAMLAREQQIDILLPRETVGLEQLREHPLELEEGSLSHFILKVAEEVLQQGVSFGESDRVKNGIHIYLKDQQMIIDLSDERIAEILLDHLQPRFRAMLEGTVK